MTEAILDTLDRQLTAGEAALPIATVPALSVLAVRRLRKLAVPGGGKSIVG